MKQKMDINKTIFSTIDFDEVVKVISNLSVSELQMVSGTTVFRILQEVGEKHWWSSTRKIRIADDLLVSDTWHDNVFEEIGFQNGGLYVKFSLQKEYPAASFTEHFVKFFCGGDYRHSIDLEGKPYKYTVSFKSVEKAECMRSILMSYAVLKNKSYCISDNSPVLC